jgi:hypothetical protein
MEKGTKILLGVGLFSLVAAVGGYFWWKSTKNKNSGNDTPPPIDHIHPPINPKPPQNQTPSQDTVAQKLLSGAVPFSSSLIESIFGGSSDWQKRYDSLTTQYKSADDIAKWYLQGIKNNAFPFKEWELNQFHEMFGYKAESQGHGWKNRIRELSWDTMNEINRIVSGFLILDYNNWSPLLIKEADLEYAANNN